MPEILKNTKNELSKVSSCFCVAKWSHATIYLHEGMGNSCHHPKFHKADPEIIALRPEKLLNTDQKILARKRMMEGERPPECQHCWTYEDATKDTYSDRFVKSAASWAKDEISRILVDPLGENFLPRYLELSFSAVCNLKCVYCGPHFSTAWQNELKSPKTLEQTPEENPYKKAFWLLWPKLMENLRVLRITGGEPLLSHEVLDLLNSLTDSKNNEITLIVNSNLSVPTQQFEKYYKVLSDLVSSHKVKKVKIVTSLEAMGSASDYIRSGINQNLFWSHVERILGDDLFDLSITATINVLCVNQLRGLYEKCADLKKAFGPKSKEFFIDPTLLKSPTKLNILNFPDSLKTQFIDECKGILSDSKLLALSKYEYFRLETVARVVGSKLGFAEQKDIVDLIHFLKTLDRRRGSSFAEVFPEVYAGLNSELGHANSLEGRP